MQLILQQTFPLGRFHATPWKAFPYDDPHGEWPPSPWRLVRAVLARSFQLDREVSDSTATHAALRESIVHAFATSEISFRLTASTWRGPGLRQYQPAEFKRVPASAEEPGMMAYNTTKVLDNFWVTSSGDAAAVVWLLDGPEWTGALLAHLDACLARITYFGRAESITKIRRLVSLPDETQPLVKLLPRRTGKAVPVLTLKSDASLAQLEATTDAPSVRDTDIPPGSRWMYAERPARPAIKPMPRTKPALPPVSLMQFAIGSKVAPSYKNTVWITERFRGRATANLIKALTGNAHTKLADMTPEVREQMHRFLGKEEDGRPAKGHLHPVFFLSGERDAPSRLGVWRAEPFNDTEQRAVLDASTMPLPLNHKDEPWTLTLVPLDKLVPPPPGLETKAAHRCWKTLTPYVPAKHVHGRNGKEKPGCSVREQLIEELSQRHFDTSGMNITFDKAGWVKLHRTRQDSGGQTNQDKLGYKVTLEFPESTTGPIFLGHSCHFGLGLFVPIH